MRKKRGFTLIELLVAITIGMLIIGFGSISLNDFFEKQKVETATEELVANLRLARNYAITNQFTDDGNKLLVTISNDGLIELKSYKKDDTYIKTTFSEDVTPKNVWINIVGNKEIKFSVTDGRSINGAIDIGVSGTNLVKNIKIDESGLIYGI